MVCNYYFGSAKVSSVKMASVPTTIVVFTQDKIHFPIKMALVVVKQLFQYGVRDIFVKNDKIYIQLTYSPKSITLKKKFGNLPVKYMRSKINNEEELKILEKVVRRYRFNLLDEEVAELPRQVGTRKLYLEEPPVDVTSTTSTSASASTTNPDIDNNNNMDLENSQIFE